MAYTISTSVNSGRNCPN